MLFAVVSIALCSFGQASDAGAQAVKREIFETDKGVTYYGQLLQEDGGVMRLQLDMPYEGKTGTQILRRDELKRRLPETSAERERRYREGYEAQGVMLLGTLENPEFVNLEEYRLLEKAKDMREKAEQAAAAHVGTGTEELETVLPEVEAKTVEPPGFLTLWGAHIVTIIVALGLIGVIVKMMIL
ncbi:MAG: hypothetical protein KJ052_06955 [Candidatus Hydrogenedentes bacterium]|nr:hypothetical protein [Candidatus Hydrogenedentota bacterium]